MNSMESNKILNIPSMSMFNNDWNLLLKFMENEGNPPFHFDGNLRLITDSIAGLVSVRGDLYLKGCKIKSIGNLKSVGGSLNLGNTNIKSLGNLERVGGSLNLERCESLETIVNLISVGFNLNLNETNIRTLGVLNYVGGTLDLSHTNIESFDKLEFIGGNLYLVNTPNLKMSDDDIRINVNIRGRVYGKR